MIDSIKLHDFQGYDNGCLVFDPGFNVIIGESDQGKSSIIKAVEWVRKNRPKGFSFIREGAEKTEVYINTNGIKIGRIRSRKDTGKYIVGGEEFSSMGSDVPPMVTGVLGLDDINVQLQLDGHFLILDPPGKVAQYFNRVTKLDKLTDALKELKSRKLKNAKKTDKIDSEITEIDVYFSTGISECHTKLIGKYKEVVSKIDEEKNVDEKRKKLSSVLEDISKYKNAFVYQKKVRFIKSLLDELDVKFLEMENIFSKKNELSRVLENIKKYTQEIVPEKQLNQFYVLIKKVNDCINELEKVSNAIAELKNAIDSYSQAKINLSRCKNELNVVSKDKNEIKKQLQNCPYCGSKLTIESRKKLLS